MVVGVREDALQALDLERLEGAPVAALDGPLELGDERIPVGDVIQPDRPALQRGFHHGAFR